MNCKLVVLAVALLTGCGGSQVSKVEPSKAYESDADYKLVSVWLSGNLNDPNIEVVRWWPAKKLPEVHDKVVAILEKRVKDLHERSGKWIELVRQQRAGGNLTDESGSLRAEIQEALSTSKRLTDELVESRSMLNYLKEKGPGSFCRLRYCGRNKFNALTLQDDLFVIREGKVIPSDTEWSGLIRAEFPE